MPCRFPGPHPRGKLRRIWLGGVSRPTPKEEVEGDLARGVSWPTPGEVSRPIPSGGLSQHALRQNPPFLTTTAAGGTHPTRMHSC